MDCAGDLMARFRFEGIDNYIAQIEKIYNDTDAIIGVTIYEGADVVMDYVESALRDIQVDNRYGTAENKTIGPNSFQKEGLFRSVGISKLRKDGFFWNVKIGFSGYNQLRTKSWPQGQPNAMVARSIESGTSWMQKQPFLRKAEQAAKVPCERAMQERIDKEYKARIKE